MDKKKYEAQFNEHLLEQYKLYVQMADNVSNRRAQTNAFYISLISAIFLFLSIIFDRNLIYNIEVVIFLGISFLGILICAIWCFNITSYKQLNSGKFKVIHEMEKLLPFPCFDKEWELLGREKESKKYLPMTHVEFYIPIIFSIPFIILIIYIFYLGIR